MCGRYYIDPDNAAYREIIRRLDENTPADLPESGAASGEIFPSDTVPVYTAQGPRLMTWGLSRADGKGLIINARSETAAQKNLFRPLLAGARCLVPACAYYEWTHGAAAKQKYRLKPASGTLFYMAGLFRDPGGNTPPAFVILTAPAAGGIAFLHERMPLILPQSAAKDWLYIPARAQEILHAPEQDIGCEPVEP